VVWKPIRVKLHLRDWSVSFVFMKKLTSNDGPSPWVLILLSCVVFMAVVNGTMINVGLPYIGRDFGVSEGVYGWIVTGFTLTFGVFSAIHGRLADIFGIKRLYLIGIGIFSLTSLTVAMAPTIEIAIALRILQGAGAAAMPVLGSTIIATLYPANRRGAAMGVILMAVGLAASIGPFIGGVLVQWFGWRSMFVLTGCVVGAIPFGLKMLPDSLNDTVPSKFDGVGALLLLLAVSSLMIGFSVLEHFGFGWELGLDVALTIVLHVAFLAWIRVKKDPFVSPQVMSNLRYLAVCFVAFLSNATRFGTIVLVPILLTEVAHLEPVIVGLVLLPGAIAITILSRYSGKLADRFGPRIPVTLGTTFIIIGNVVTALFAGISVPGIALGMGLYGMGFAMIQTPCVSAVSQIVPKNQLGVATGMFMMIFFIGGGTGVAVSVTVVELQAFDALSWIGLESGLAARYSNAMLVLCAMAIAGLALIPSLPSRESMNLEE